MKLLVFVLNVPEKLEDVLAAYVECGITGATVIDSVGMGHLMARTIPMFAGFQHLIRGTRAHNKTLFSVVDDDAKVERLLRVLQDVCGPFDQAGSGIVFTVPLESVRGIRPDEA